MHKRHTLKLTLALMMALPFWSCSLAQPAPPVESPSSQLRTPPPLIEGYSAVETSDLLMHQFGLVDFGQWVDAGDATEYPTEWRDANMNYAQASIALALNQHTLAREQIEEALKVNPDLDYLYTRLAMTYYMENDAAQALASLERGLQRRPDSLIIQFLKARMLEEQRRMDEAITVYEDILTSHPNHIETLSNLAETYFRTNQKRERTKELCRHILELNGRHYPALLLLGTLETIDGNIDEAVDYLDRAIRRRRWEPWRVLNIARIMERNRRTAEAARLYTLLMEYYPDNEEIRKRWEEMVVQRSGEDGLITAYEELIKKNPASESLYTVYAQYLIRNNRIDKALEVYQQLQYVQPDNLYVNLLRGFEALRAGDLETAQINFDEYLMAGGEESSATPYIQVAMFYSQFGHDDKAEEIITNAMMFIEESHPPLLLTLAELKEKKRDFAAAEEIYLKLAAASPSIAAYQAMLGQCYQLQGKMPEALKAFVEAQTKAMPSPRYLMDAALLALDLELTDQVASLIQMVMDAQQDADSKMRVALLAATAYDQFGLNDETQKWADQALEIEPYNQYAQNLLIFAEVKRSRNYSVLQSYPEYIAQIADKNTALNHQLNLARLQMTAHQPEEAVDTLEAALKDGAPAAVIAPQLAPALAEAGREQEALQTVDWIDPRQDANTYLTTKAEVFKHLKRYHDAEETLLKYLETNALLLDAYVQLGALYQIMGAWAEAEDIYKRAMGLFPYDYNLLNNYGYMLALRGVRLDEAEEMIRFALRLNPGAGYILDSLAWVEFQRGYYEKAIELLNMAWTRSLPEAEIAIHLAETYAMLNQTDKAKEFYEKALMLDPKNEEASRGLADLK